MLVKFSPSEMSFKRKWSYKTKVQLESHLDDAINRTGDSEQNKEINVAKSTTLQKTALSSLYSDEIELSGKIDFDTVSQVENSDVLDSKSIDVEVNEAIICLGLDTCGARELFVQSEDE